MKEDPESALSAGIVANVPMKRYRPQMGSIKAKVILNIDPHLRMGRKDEALLQEKFLDGIEKAEQEEALKGLNKQTRRCSWDKNIVHEAYQFLQQAIKKRNLLREDTEDQ